MATQVTNQYADIYDWENLYLAYRKAAKGKCGRIPAAGFEFRYLDSMVWLQWLVVVFLPHWYNSLYQIMLSHIDVSKGSSVSVRKQWNGD
ncbi:hypothetical protein KFU94_64035 [Chloroflexi bacterium TSY]|nr:hypothetical protein [Chloroflexi bacterium TSY]